MKASTAPFRLGVNYWPAETAVYWWSSFDPSIVQRDFERIVAAGFDTVRIFLTWEAFQPVPDEVSRGVVDALVTVCAFAEAVGLSVIPTLFTGHMSGANWIPGWALDPGGPGAIRFPVISGGRVTRAGLRNRYSDGAIQSAQASLCATLAARLAHHPAVWAWDLGNENSNCVVPPNRALALGWLERMASALRSADPSHPITIGLHMEDLEEDRRLGPAEAASVCDFLCMHGYPMYADWARGPTDALLLPFLALVTRWLGGRDVLFEEFGAPTSPPGGPPSFGTVVALSEEEAADFTRQALHELRTHGSTGALFWCYADYPPPVWSRAPFDRAEHERHFGLWRSDGSPKPAVAVVRPMAGLPREQPADVAGWIDIAPTDYHAQPRQQLKRLYGRFCSFVEQWVEPSETP